MVVAVLIGITNKSLDKTFDYAVPSNLENNMKVGIRVKVPFGKMVLLGYVLEIKDNSNCDKLKEVISLIDEEVILSDELLDLGKYLQKITLASLSSCYQAMLPKVFKANLNSHIGKKYQDVYSLNTLELKDYKLTLKQQEVIDKFKLKDKLTKKELDVSFSVINTLVKNNILCKEKVEVYRLEDEVYSFKKNELTSLQKECLNKILNTDKMVSLLYGVTGSGKTEVYMELIANYLNKGFSSIMLVPEISLTPQMIKRFKERFGNNIALLHSALSDGERYDEYRKIMHDEVKIVLGARSALFAPIKNLGLIIIDEEQSDSYKQDNNPRYNAKDIALYRAKYNKAKVVLGSATPVLESFARAQKGVYQLACLTERVNGKKLPRVHLIDMNKESKFSKYHFSEPLIMAIKETLEKGEQVILLLNHRGYSSVLTCSNCNEAVKCPYCDITLTYHKSSNMLRCHYCGYAMKYTVTCPKCHANSLQDIGVGTEKIEEELNQLFAPYKTIRMDVDTTSRKGAHKKIITAFANHEADILLGTQMVAKGLDFPLVTLVGVINADTSLLIPDFRSSERCFDLLSQVAGRSGRSEKEGRVYFQTYNPDNYAIKCASRCDFLSFYNEEMKIRKLMKYPPYYYLVVINMASKDEKLALLEISRCEATIKKYLTNTIILGPSPASIFKKQNIYRYQLILKYKYEDKLYDVLDRLVKYYSSLNKVSLEIDFNPLHF